MTRPFAFSFLLALPSLAAPVTSHSLDVETGLLAQTGSSTPIDYRIVPTQLSWRSPAVISRQLENGSALLLRNRISLLTYSIVEGPESHYIGFSAAPSIEWWCPSNRWSLNLAVGGGAGLIDSTDTEGGQGQDFTFNWFARLGMEHKLSDQLSLIGSLTFQHFSNMGATDPNPGIDVSGLTFGASYSF